MSAPRSLIALLVGTVVFFVLWMVALKPSSSNSGGSSSSQGLGAYRSDINKAKQAVTTSNASNAASGNENAGSTAGSPAAASPAATGSSASAKHPTSGSAAKPASKPSSGSATKPAASQAGTRSATAAQTLSTVQTALADHKVVAMLFYNPLAADDQAVKQELAVVPSHAGRVVKVPVPLSQAANFTGVTQQIPLNFSPTLVLISPSGRTSELVGYSDSFEIDQRVAAALATS